MVARTLVSLYAKIVAANSGQFIKPHPFGVVLHTPYYVGYLLGHD